MNSSSHHHRSYSDAPASADRLRLPPISNLIEDVRQPDVSYRSAFPNPHAKSLLPMDSRQARPHPMSPDARPWSPNNDLRSPYHPAQQPQHETRPASERYHSWADPRRASIAVTPSSGAEATISSSPGFHRSISGPLSPNAITTAKSVVREDVIPGKGHCYVYDDGTICQKYINGDTVNPKWGTTKAGKPRKRLGQACNTCREKKIKCDPSYPKCTQCQKFGRECRFEAPSRNPNKSPKMQPDESPTSVQTTEDLLRTRRPSVALTEASSHSESGTISSRAAGTIDDNLSPLTNDSDFRSDTPGPSKKAKLSQTDSDLTAKLYMSSHDPHDPQYPFALEVDPFDVDRKLVLTYLALYFNHVNGSAFPLVPERLFLEWAENSEDKSQVSKLVLYCMLAVGCSFSKSPEKFVHSRIFASIALEGITQSFGHFSMQLIQARLIFALHEFQHGREDKAWDLCGFAMRTACAMSLNTEEGIAQQVRDSGTVYGLDPTQLSECMRRTFWIAYTMDNLGVACLSITTSFSKTDCSLRLPCSKQAYKNNILPKTPIFEGDMQLAKPVEADLLSNVGTLGYLTQIASLCCDVRTLAYKASRRTNYTRHKRYAAAREDLETQLRMWNERYTSYIKRQYSRSAPHKDYPFSFGGLHLVYHYACMQLHRHLPHTQLTRETITEHVQLAYHHAEKTLAIAQQLVSRKSLDIVNYHFAASSPLSGYAVHYAIDILSAAGVNARLLENQSPVLDLLLNSVQLLDNLAEVWSSARIQRKQVSDRITFVMHSARAGIAEGKVGFCMEESMVSQLSKDEDLVYGVDRLVYLNSFDWAAPIQHPSDLNTISNKGKRGSYSLWKD